ncbi:MAG: hypothetical protein F4151_12655, partial [Gammaproteobacteria bacterium]|nr:hypothetical protein [Gammaproteobacteria bacterium]
MAGARAGSRVNGLLAVALFAGCILAVACADAADAPRQATPDSDMAVAATRQAAPPNTLTEAERAAGWRLLFDGETT